MISFLRKRLGPVWWSTLLLFFGMRITDLFNMVTGIWLVPHFIPQEELGSVLPLTELSRFLALPLTILLIPYTKLLSIFHERGEFGKSKALLRDASLFAGVFLLLSLAASPFILEFAFIRFKIENGRLALAATICAVLTALAPLFSEILRAGRRFSIATVNQALRGPIRFLAMLLFLPFRGLTGYFVGQSAVPIFDAMLAVGDFFRRHRKVRAESYRREARSIFAAYTLPLAVLTLLMSARTTSELCLMAYVPEIESAAYYQLTRFSEVATYFGAAIIFVLFPLTSARSEHGEETRTLLVQALLVIAALGAAMTLGLLFIGPVLFRLIPSLLPYQSYTPLFLPLGVLAAVRIARDCFTTHELACGRFRYVPRIAAVNLLELLCLALLAKGPECLRFSSLFSADWSIAAMIRVMLLFTALELLSLLPLLRSSNPKTGSGDSL